MIRIEPTRTTLAACCGLFLCTITLLIEPLLEVRNIWAQNSGKPAANRPVDSGQRASSSAAGDAAEHVAAARSAARLGGPAQVTGVKLLSLSDQTRVMVDLSRETQFQVGRVKGTRTEQTPNRLFVDVLNARLSPGAKDLLPVGNDFLRQVRLGQHTAEVVRVVLDLNGDGRHRTFMIKQPAQLVIDVLAPGVRAGNPAKEAAVGPVATVKRAARAKKMEPSAGRAGLRKIVIDPGHGGKDPGAIGVGGMAEKDLVLSVAQKLARKLKSDMGIQVILTRTDDRFVALEDRTALANSEDADLFISLHMNASPNSEARGIETYYLDNTTDEAAIRLAARENSGSRRNISDLQFILSDMTQNMKLEDSITLAHRLQGALVGGMGKVMTEVRDLGVKKALFHVLVGARMPSVLVEMFFITHPAEGRALSRESYQDAMVEALYDGIAKFGHTHVMAKTL